MPSTIAIVANAQQQTIKKNIQITLHAEKLGMLTECNGKILKL